MTAAKRREGLRAAGTTSGTAEEKQPHRYAQEPGNSQVPPATEERGWGSLHPSGCWGPGLGEHTKAGACQRCCLLLPMLSMYLPEMHREVQGIRHQQFHQRGWDGLAQVVKADPQPFCPSDVRLHEGTACPLLRAICSPGNGSTGWVTATS